MKLRALDWIDELARSARAYLQKQVARGALYVTTNVREEMQKLSTQILTHTLFSARSKRSK